MKITIPFDRFLHAKYHNSRKRKKTSSDITLPPPKPPAPHAPSSFAPSTTPLNLPPLLLTLLIPPFADCKERGCVQWRTKGVNTTRFTQKFAAYCSSLLFASLLLVFTWRLFISIVFKDEISLLSEAMLLSFTEDEISAFEAKRLLRIFDT